MVPRSCAERRERQRRHELGRFVIVEYTESDGEASPDLPSKRQAGNNFVDRQRMHSDTVLLRNKYASSDLRVPPPVHRNIFAITKEDPSRFRNMSSELQACDTECKTVEAKTSRVDQAPVASTSASGAVSGLEQGSADFV